MKLTSFFAIAVAGAALASCASPQGAAGGASSADQVRQQELKQMEAQGQRNDFDKPFKKN